MSEESGVKPFEEIPELKAKSRGRDPTPFDPMEPTLLIHNALESPIYRFSIKAEDGKVQSVWVNDPKAAKKILVDEEHKWRKGQQTWEPFSSLVPLHLISLEGDLHAHMRRRAQAALGDALSSGKIRGDLIGQKLINNIRRAIESPSLNTWMGTREKLGNDYVLVVPSVDRVLRSSALDIVTSALFGISWDVVDDYTPTNRRAYALLDVMHELHWRVADFNSRAWRRDHRANIGERLDLLDAFIMDEIEISRTAKDRSEPRRMLDAWAWDDNLSTEQVRNLAMTFLTMGSENVSTALSWCLIQLAENPVAQNAARHSFEALSRCFDETMRLYPSVPVLTRHCLEETELCGYKIPRCTEVIVNLYAIHRNHDIWGEESSNFKHDRCPVISTNGPPDAIPFGGGARSCVGRPLTNHEVRNILFPLIQAFEVYPVTRADDGSLKVDSSARTMPNNFISYRPGVHLIAFKPVKTSEATAKL